MNELELSFEVPLPFGLTKATLGELLIFCMFRCNEIRLASSIFLVGDYWVDTFLEDCFILGFFRSPWDSIDCLGLSVFVGDDGYLLSRLPAVTNFYHMSA